MSADGPDMESTPAVPPDWSSLTNMEISKFAESVAVLLKTGVFPAALAEELSAYREKANEEMRVRVQRADERRAAAHDDLPFRPVSMNGDGRMLWTMRLSRDGRGATGQRKGSHRSSRGGSRPAGFPSGGRFPVIRLRLTTTTSARGRLSGLSNCSRGREGQRK
jgi:hypothetical protein